MKLTEEEIEVLRELISEEIANIDVSAPVKQNTRYYQILKKLEDKL